MNIPPQPMPVPDRENCWRSLLALAVPRLVSQAFGAKIMKRFEQATLIISFIAFSWLAMQVVHELGHVVAAWLTKAEITKVALHPCIVSRTDIGHNPHPSIVVWAGPIVGAALPLLAFLVAKVCRAPGVYLFRFFAGF